MNHAPTLRRSASMPFESITHRPASSGSATPAERHGLIGGTTLLESNHGHGSSGGSNQGHGTGGKHKWTGVLKNLTHQANPSFHSSESLAMASGLTTPKSVASSEGGTPTTESDDWDEKWMMREKEKEREKRNEEERRKKRKTEASYVLLHCSSLLLC